MSKFWLKSLQTTNHSANIVTYSSIVSFTLQKLSPTTNIYLSKYYYDNFCHNRMPLALFIPLIIRAAFFSSTDIAAFDTLII